METRQGSTFLKLPALHTGVWRSISYPGRYYCAACTTGYSPEKEIVWLCTWLSEDCQSCRISAMTVHELAKPLNDYRPLDIVTNSPPRMECSDAERHNVFLPGKMGENRSLTRSCVCRRLSRSHDILLLGRAVFWRKGSQHSYQELR